MANLSMRTEELSYQDALHLARRATFHPSLNLVKTLEGKTPQAAVDLLLGMGSTPTPPAWADLPPNFTDINAVYKQWGELQMWWMQHVLTVPSLREKIVLFWHNHFTSDYITVYAAQFMVRQAKLIREKAFSFRDLAEAMIGDPAMLIYLNGNLSLKGNPNENFGREWFELFTLGVGNYTEQDIIEAARAFTGWRIAGSGSVYNPQFADQAPKTILGQTGNWEYTDVVRITLETEACRLYIALKLYRLFFEYNPSAATLAQVADVIRLADYDITAAIRTLLTSEHFYEAQLRGALIKSPADLTIGLAAMTSTTNVHPNYPQSAMTALNQEPFYPPTVEGWKGHHNWITSSTFPSRQRFAESYIDGRYGSTSDSLRDLAGIPIAPDLVAMAKAFPDSNDAVKLVAHFAEYLLPVAASKEQRDVLLEILLAGAPVYEWDIESPAAKNRLKLLVQAIVRMPEFQLM